VSSLVMQLRTISRQTHGKGPPAGSTRRKGAGLHPSGWINKYRVATGCAGRRTMLIAQWEPRVCLWGLRRVEFWDGLPGPPCAQASS